MKSNPFDTRSFNDINLIDVNWFDIFPNDLNSELSDVKIIINIDVNEAPTSITLDTSSVIENDLGGHIANITGEDPDGDSLTYSVLSGQDSNLVEVDGSTVKFKSGVSADYENDQSLEFTLRAIDPDGLYKDKAFSLNVVDYIDRSSPVMTNFEITNNNLSAGDSAIITFTGTDESSISNLDALWRFVDDTGYISEFRFWGTPTLISDDLFNYSFVK